MLFPKKLSTKLNFEKVEIDIVQVNLFFWLNIFFSINHTLSPGLCSFEVVLLFPSMTDCGIFDVSDQRLMHESTFPMATLSTL